MGKVEKCKQLQADFGEKGKAFGGPKYTVFFADELKNIQVVIKQGINRVITISADHEVNASELYRILLQTEQLLMMF
nr:hypothetical protein [bacterium]